MKEAASNQQPPPGIDTPPETMSIAVGELARAKGTRGAARALEVSPQTVGKLAGGLPVLRATLSHVSGRLAALETTSATAAG